MLRPRHTLLALILACGGSDPGTTTDTDAGTDTGTGTGTETDTGTDTDTGGADLAEGCDGAVLLVNPEDPAARGPWPVGARTVDIDGLTVELWYPAAPGSDAGARAKVYDIRDSLPDSLTRGQRTAADLRGLFRLFRLRCASSCPLASLSFRTGPRRQTGSG